jgi:hypothetical protein
MWTVAGSTYTRDSLPPGASPATLVPPLAGFIGPRPEIEDEASLMDMLSRSGGAYGPARVVGHDQLLGRAVDVIEFGGTWLTTDMTASEPVKTGGTGRIWLDPVDMVVLRYEAEVLPDGSKQTLEVTAFARGPQDTSRFDFHPPDGAVQVTPRPTTERFLTATATPQP